MKKGAVMILAGLLIMLSAAGLADWAAQTTASKVNVRYRPSSSSSIITQIQDKGTVVTVEDETTDNNGYTWYSIVTSDGETGYIRGDFIEPYNSFGTQPTVYSIDYQALYSNYFINYRQRDIGSVSGSFEVRDLDRDGIPEMILKYYGVYVYTAEGTEVVPLAVWMLVEDELIYTGSNHVEGDGTVYYAKNGQGMAVGTEGVDILMYSCMKKIGNDLIEQSFCEMNHSNGLHFMVNGEEAWESDFIGMMSNYDVPENSVISVYAKGVADPMPERTLPAGVSSAAVAVNFGFAQNADTQEMQSETELSSEMETVPGAVQEGMEHNTLEYLNSITLEDLKLN